MSYMPWKIIKNCLERDCILRIMKGGLCAEEKCKTTMYGAKIIEMRNKKDEKRLEASENVGLQQFHILGAAGCIGNTLGFLGNVIIYGWTVPSILCAVCALVMLVVTIWGSVSRHVLRASYIIIAMVALMEFPMLYYVYKSGTIAYMVLAIVAIANFMKKKHAFIFGAIAIAEDICTILLAYYYPVHIEQVTEINALSTTLCSFIVTVISLFLITALGSAQQRRQKERLEAMTEQLRSAADHDALTGLYNRRYLNHYMEKIMGAAHADFYTALMDLDFFKKINDKYGHFFGDEVLIGFADIMNRYLPDDGISVRFGGEEFLLVLPQMTEEQVRDLLEKMRQDYKAFGRQKCGEDFTFSCGIERYVADMEITALFSRADDKLYQAKQKGRDCVV